MGTIGNDEVGEAIRKARRSRDLSQTKLAEELGVGLSTVYCWERGRKGVSTMSANKLMSYFCDTELATALARRREFVNVPLNLVDAGKDPVQNAAGSLEQIDLIALYSKLKGGIAKKLSRFLQDSVNPLAQARMYVRNFREKRGI